MNSVKKVKTFISILSSKSVFILLIFTILLCGCSEQKSKNVTHNIISKKDIVPKQSGKKNFKNSLLFTGNNHQINQVVRTVFQDSKRNLWFGTESGAFKFNGDTLIYIHQIKNNIGKGVTIKAITESKDGKIWLGHTGGISSVKGELVKNYYQTDGLISNDVWCITADVNGGIWVGTTNGVCVFDGQQFLNFELPKGKIDPTKGVSTSKMVHHILEDSKGTMWFSSNAGLFSYANHKLMDVSKKFGIKTKFVNEVFEDKSGELWISTKKGLYHLQKDNITNITEGKIKNGKGIGSIAEDKDGKIWFVSNQHFLYTYDREKLTEYQKTEENKGPAVFQIYKDYNDRLWFVGFGGAYRLENGKFLNITKNGPW